VISFAFFAFACFSCFARIIPASFTSLGGPVFSGKVPRQCPHAHGVAHLVEPYRPRGVSNTQTVLSLTLNARRPRLRRGLLQQHRVVLGCLKRRVFWKGGGSFPPWSFLPIGIGERPVSDSLAFWQSHLPPQFFLPVGIGEVTPVTSFALFNFVSLHSLSYLWVSGR